MNRNPNRNSIQNPGRYDMYAAFRTRERAEERERKRRSVYEINSAAQNRQKPGTRSAQTQNHSGSVYHINRTSVPPQKKNVQTTAQHRQTPLRYGQGVSRKKSRPQYGTRVYSGANAYRYGYHSSYRTSDGRILDGFDASGRPIYREAGASGTDAVVTRTEAALDARRLHPTRRIRIETMTDVKRKPFPFLTVLMVFLSTALVMGVLYTYMKLNEYTGELSILTYRVTNLRNEANALSAEVVRREDLIAIEQTAADTLGMVKNDILPKRYVSIENEDKTELVQKKKEEERKRQSVEIDLDTGMPAEQKAPQKLS